MGTFFDWCKSKVRGHNMKALTAGPWVDEEPVWREFDITQNDGSVIRYSGYSCGAYRNGPPDWQNMFGGNEAGIFNYGPKGSIPYCAFTSYAQNGDRDEEAGRVWGTPGFVGSGDRYAIDEKTKIGDFVLLNKLDEVRFVEDMKRDVDRSLRAFGWNLDDDSVIKKFVGELFVNEKK